MINLSKTWDKLMMAARVIVAVENPQDVVVQSARPYGQRSVLKFSQYTGTKAIAGRHTPGTFTNQSQARTFEEPRVLVLTDPRTDHQVTPPLHSLSVHTPLRARHHRVLHPPDAGDAALSDDPQGYTDGQGASGASLCTLNDANCCV